VSGAVRSVVVVVDGDAWIHRSIAAAFASAGSPIDVVPCTTARGGLNACCALEPDCVITELVLGDQDRSGDGIVIDGMWLAAELRRQEAPLGRVPIVMTSARADEETRIAALRGGVDVFFPKPFAATEMCGQVRAMIAMAQRLREGRASAPLLAPPVPGPVGNSPRAMVGDLRRINVATVLTALELERQSGDLVLKAGRPRGGVAAPLVLNIAEGVLVGAWRDDVPLTSLEAVRLALRWPGRRFEFIPSEGRRLSSNAETTTMGMLVLEALRLEDKTPVGQRDYGLSGAVDLADPEQSSPLSDAPSSSEPAVAWVDRAAGSARPAPARQSPRPAMPPSSARPAPASGGARPAAAPGIGRYAPLHGAAPTSARPAAPAGPGSATRYQPPLGDLAPSSQPPSSLDEPVDPAVLRQAAESAPGRRLVESVLRGRRVDPRIEPDAHEDPVEAPVIGALDELVLAEQLAHLTAGVSSSPPPPASHERARPPLRRSASPSKEGSYGASRAIMPPPRGASSAPAPAPAGAAPGSKGASAAPAVTGVVVPTPGAARQGPGKGTLPFGALDLDLDELGAPGDRDGPPPRTGAEPPASGDSRVRNKERQAGSEDEWLDDHTTRQLRLGR
jgi:DNA-binding response OmpR family regulator